MFVNHARGYIEEKNGNKYLIFDDYVNENKGLLKNTQMFGMELKTKSKQEMLVKKIITKKLDYMKIKFNSDDDLPLNKPLKFHAMTIIIRSLFKEGGKLYSQVF